MLDQEPHEAFAADVQAAARSTWQKLIDRGSEWLTRTLLALLAAAIGSSALAIVVLPVFVGVACALITLAAVIYAIYARRLMDNERRMRRWAHIQGKRVQQAQLKANANVDNAVLVISGDRQAGFDSLGNRELAQAVRHLQARSQQAARAERPQPTGASVRQPAIPAAPDLAPVRRRIAQRKAEIKALEGEIQALAVPHDQELKAAAHDSRRAERELSSAARQADRQAQDRRRRGLTPTVTPGRELGLQLTMGPEGVRHVSRQPDAPTPEEITDQALKQEPPS